MPESFIVIKGRRLEVARIRGETGKPTMVFLHEGLGSVATWRDFPARVVEATGCPALVYSRYNYGQSDPLGMPYEVDYMHREALEVLPRLLRELDIEAPLLLGHSDGASIGLIYAGSGMDVKALIVEAPHVFVEDISIDSIAKARVLYTATDLPIKLARHHAHPDEVFWGWNNIWLTPGFRNWNLEGLLGKVRCSMPGTRHPGRGR